MTNISWFSDLDLYLEKFFPLISNADKRVRSSKVCMSKDQKFPFGSKVKCAKTNKCVKLNLICNANKRVWSSKVHMHKGLKFPFGSKVKCAKTNKSVKGRLAFEFGCYGYLDFH